MKRLMTQKQKAAAYKEILEGGHSRAEIQQFILGMTAIETEGVLQYAEEVKGRAMEFIDTVAEYNPQLPKRYEMSNHYVEASRVIRLILEATGRQAPKVERDYGRELDEISKQENRFWKGLPMKEVVSHFLVMTKRNSGNGSPFLTEEQLVSFLKKGFLGDTSLPKQIINCTYGEKGFVIKRFYQLFDLAASKYGHPGRTEKFVRLFLNCFNNWDEKTIRPFFKPNKVRESW